MVRLVPKTVSWTSGHLRLKVIWDWISSNVLIAHFRMYEIGYYGYEDRLFFI